MAENKLALQPLARLVYDFHDIDGAFYMLDREMSGCLAVNFNGAVDPGVKGTVTLDGQVIEGCVVRHLALMDFWLLGIPLRGYVTEYEKVYHLHVEGYVDPEGRPMEPADLVVHGPERTEPDPAYAEHEAIALQAAQEGIVLLKNEKGTLPLKPGILNLFGQGVHAFRVEAVGAGKINPRYMRNFTETVRKRDGYALNEELISFYAGQHDRIPPEDMLARAKEASDTAIMLISRAAGENQDNSSARGEYALTEEEEALIDALAGAFSHLVIILDVGYPIGMSFADKADAIVYPGLAGMLAGPALMDVLTGKVNPSGKLPDTWARHYEDLPTSRNFYDCVDKPRLDSDSKLFADTCYEEDIYVGYRYFTTFHKEAAFPFGFGLSYTTFAIETGKVSADESGFHVSAVVKNTGTVPGREVVQVYVGKPDTELEKAERELVAFEKTEELDPGVTETFAFSIPEDRLTSYSEEKAAYLLEAGDYQVYVGNSSLAPAAGNFTIPETKVIKQVTNLMQPEVKPKALSKWDPEGTWPKGMRSGVVEGKETWRPYAPRRSYAPAAAVEKPSERVMYDDVRRDPEKAGAFAAQLSVEELARLSVCASHGWGMEGVGEAGRVYKLENYGMPDFPVADGNSGVNLRKKNIGMPTGTTLCATWNKDLAYDVGRVIGEEAKELGIPLILAPAFNIHRHPLNGRQPEYFSEDPYLAGTMAGNYSEGMEGAGVGSCYKHFLANNAETTRKRNQSIISERAIREIYFRAFEYAMQVHIPASFMTAYNAVNGCPTSTDEELLMGLLREESGFTGFVMTDWTTYDSVDVAPMVQAGNTWITPGSTDQTYTDMILEGVNDGTVSVNRLRENIESLIRTMARFA